MSELKLRPPNSLTHVQFFPADSSPARGEPAGNAANLLVLSFVLVEAVVCGAFLVLGTRRVQFEQYLLLLGFFGPASALFIFSRVRENLSGSSIFRCF